MHWRLYQVRAPTPIAPSPIRILSTDQATMVLSVPRPAATTLRLRYSSLLEISGPAGATPATLSKNTTGWTNLSVTTPGKYTLHG